ncbi:MAG: ParB domain-containing protein nuclease [Rhodospirillaceae bacterium]|nr:MAG: ParB domain-containing protein nuclease [Rhodospirillaceae bacterium]
MTQPVRKSAHEMAREREALAKAEDEARQKALYGDLLSHVQVLRKRGFVVTAAGGGKYLVGNKLLDKAEVRAMARREGGLAGMAFTRPGQTASGLKVGDTVALVPKKPATATPLPTTKEKAVAAAVAPPPKPAKHSTDLGVRPRVVWLDLALLVIDKTYQREISKMGAAHVNRILLAFNWNHYQPIVVSERDDGTYAVIDGQHRLEAAKRHPLIDSLPCYIIEAPDAAKQAAIFVAVNSRRIALTSLQQFHAAVAARQPEAMVAAGLCADAGVTILKSPPSYDIPPRSIISPFTLLKMVRHVGRPAVATAIKILAETHPATLNAFRSPTIAALCRVVADPKIDVAKVRAVLAATDLARFYDDTRNGRVTSGGTLETSAERVLRERIARHREVSTT